MRVVILSLSEFVSSFLFVLMNIVSWNCRGALNPTFNNSVRDLVQTLSPTVLIIT